MLRKFQKELQYQISQVIATLVGLVLVTIGLSGALDVALYPIQEISFLLEPMTQSPFYDRLYWITLATVGLWLVVLIWARPAALAAIILIAFKWAVLEGFLVL